MDVSGWPWIRVTFADISLKNGKKSGVCNGFNEAGLEIFVCCRPRRACVRICYFE